SAKARVGWTVAGCAPGVRTMPIKILFQWTTGSTVGMGDAEDTSRVAPVRATSPAEELPQAAARRPRLIGRTNALFIGHLARGRRGDPCWDGIGRADRLGAAVIPEGMK